MMGSPMNLQKLVTGLGILVLTTVSLSTQASVITYSTTFSLADTAPLVDRIERLDDNGDPILDPDGNRIEITI